MFASDSSLKVRRLRRDSRACLLIARPAGEREEWVAIDGRVTVSREKAFELVARSAARYWDLTDDYYSSTLDDRRQVAEEFVRLELVPGKIRSYVTR